MYTLSRRAVCLRKISEAGTGQRPVARRAGSAEARSTGRKWEPARVLRILETPKQKASFLEASTWHAKALQPAGWYRDFSSLYFGASSPAVVRRPWAHSLPFSCFV